MSNLSNWCNCSFGSTSASPFCNGASLYVNDDEKTLLSIPVSASKISDYAFYGCDNIETVSIPTTVTKIGLQAFKNCPALSTISIKSGNANYSAQDGILYNADKTNLISCLSSKSGSVTIPNSVITISDYAFYECANITSFTIPSTVKTIGTNAFSNCTGSLTVNCNIPNSAFRDSRFSKVIISNGVTSIGDYAFSSCTGLTSVTIPSSVTSIGDYAFSRCTGLTSVTIPSSVTSIGRYAFYYCTGLTSVTIPSSVTSIGRYAFSSCTGLTSVTIPSSVTSIDDDAFYSCTGLTSVTIPSSVTSIGRYAFYSCTGLTSVTIPSSVTSIGDDAFYSCTGLTSITIPSSVTSIGSSAFYSCTGTLTVNCNIPNSAFRDSRFSKVIISNGVTSIGSYAFSRCTGLTSVTIPSSVTSIGDYAFNDASNIKQIDLSSSLTNIGVRAFYGINPTAIIFRGSTPPTIDGYGSLNTGGSKRIYVPFASIDKYKDRFGTDYCYLPLLDVMFFENTNAEVYSAELNGKNKSEITSVAFYDGGIAADLTEAKIKSGMNPNCLYFVPASSGLAGNNIISLDDYTASRITLTDNYSYNCPIPFHAEEIQYDHNPSVWANGTSGWETICLPFAPHTYKASERGYISPIMLGSTGNFWLRKLVGASSDAVYFASTSDGEMKANTPYIVAFPGSSMGAGHLQGQTISFIGSNADIPVTTQPEVQKNAFIFTGNYDKAADDGEGWVLNSNGSAFVKSSVVGTDPFRGYFKNIEGSSSAAKVLHMDFSTFNETTGIEDLVGGESDVESPATVYSIDGRAMSNNKNLKSGLYIINKKKVLVK